MEAVLTCTVRSVSRVEYCFLLLEISMSFPWASFTMLCTELSLAWSTLIRDSFSCFEYSLHKTRGSQVAVSLRGMSGGKVRVGLV